LTAADREDLIAFLLTLTDSDGSRRPWTPTVMEGGCKPVQQRTANMQR
jgi:hypothetical protein